MRKKINKAAVWGLLVIILAVASLLDWNPMYAAGTQYSQPGEITITARMPFTPEFAFALSKNSQVIVERNNFAPGEWIEVKVVSMGAKDKLLKNQQLTLEVVNKDSGEKVAIFEGSDISVDAVIFGFTASEEMLGSNRIVVTNQSYERKVELKNQPVINVKQHWAEKLNGNNWTNLLASLYDWVKIG